MAETTELRRGPLDDLPSPTGGDRVRLSRPGFRTLINLRCDPEADAIVEQLGDAIGVPLPREPNTATEQDGRAVLWLGPDEWLIAAADGEAAELERRLRSAGDDDPRLSVTDLSHNHTALELEGPATREVLAKGCPLDLHARSFAPGNCAQTVLAGTGILLHATGGDSFELRVRNSFARYAHAWLRDAMEEFAP